MTKEQALYSFFSMLGVQNAYRSTAVPDDVVFPYLTYDVAISSFEEDPVSITLNLYDYTDREIWLDLKVEDIRKHIGMGGRLVECDDGYIWFKWGSPWCQSLVDATNPKIKRRYMNITAEYLTL